LRLKNDSLFIEIQKERGALGLSPPSQ